MGAELFKGSLKLGTECQQRPVLEFRDGIKIIKQVTIILTRVETVTTHVSEDSKVRITTSLSEDPTFSLRNAAFEKYPSYDNLEISERRVKALHVQATYTSTNQ